MQWADAATRSVAQEADAVVAVPGRSTADLYALAKLGYSDDDIAAIRTARRAEALDGAGLTLLGGGAA